jgi:hypothetical protein
LRRHQFETYLDKVFDFSTKVDALPEGRQSPRHNGKKIFDAVFLGAACQFPALHRIETECQKGALSKRIGPLSEDAIAYALERQDSDAIFALGCDLARELKRNGILRSDWSRGLVVAAADGIEICSSFARFCDHCMERKIKRMVDGELREDIQYYHRICAVTIVSSAFPIPLGIRFQKNGETEVACTLSLLQDLLDRVGRRFVDVLVADALYLRCFHPFSLSPSEAVPRGPFDDSFPPAKPSDPALPGQRMLNQPIIRSQRLGLRNCWGLHDRWLTRYCRQSRIIPS